MRAADGAASAEARRVVLLGASNLTMGLPRVIAMARASGGRPLEVLAAAGHGRSYGMTSVFLGRTLCGIVDCGLWEALSRQTGRGGLALVCDVGNDILYGAEPERIALWVETCVARLVGLGARPVLTGLPLEQARKVGRGRYLFFRSLFFPSSRLALEAVVARAERLDEALRQLAARHEVPLVPMRSAWYGDDPIHFRRRQRGAAWKQILSPWSDGLRAPQAAALSMAETARLFCAQPADQRLLGIARRREQPCVRLSDGTRVSFY